MDLETATDLRICIKNRPFPGESCSGDFPFYFQNENSLLLGIADGLGHGDKAHDATLKINSYLKDFWHSDVVRLLVDLNEALRSTIGAAVGVGHVDLQSGEFKYAGVGNIRAYVLGTASRCFISNDGIVGHNVRNPLLQNHSLSSGDKLVLATDGIHERFYTEGEQHLDMDTGTLAQCIMTKYVKVYDDASCLIFEY
jgi:phosphoserine phosphatase RsbX